MAGRTRQWLIMFLSGKRINMLESRLAQVEALLKDSVSPVHSATSPVATSMPKRARVQDSTSGIDVSAGAAASSSNHLLGDAKSLHATLVQARSPAAMFPLPPMAEGLQLASEYFATLNRHLPIFEESSLMARMRESYPSLGSDDPTLWAAVNIVFALSYQLRSMDAKRREADDETKTQGFLRNAIAVVDELCMRAPDMLSAQSLVGMAKVLGATSTPRAATMYVAMASRQVYSLGIHKPVTVDDGNEESREWRRRLLWVIYTSDKDCSLRLEQPHTLNDEDLDLDLPHWDPPDGLGFLPSVAGNPPFQWFRLYVNLAIIQSRVYRRLYSPQALRRVCDEKRETILDLALMLRTWKAQVPFEFEPGRLLERFPQSSVVPMVILYMRYFNCLTTVYRLSYWKVEQLEAYKSSVDDDAETSCPGQTICIKAARTALELFDLLPQGNVPCMWYVKRAFRFLDPHFASNYTLMCRRILIDYFISAVVILLAGIIYGSSYSLGLEDLRLINPVIANLDTLARCGDTERLQHIRCNCIELQSAARSLLDEHEAIGDSPQPLVDPTLQDQQIAPWLQSDLTNTDDPAIDYDYMDQATLDSLGLYNSTTV